MVRFFPSLLEPRRAWVLVLAAALAASLAGIFTLPVLDRDEARFAQATAQMLEAGDFVRISFLDEDRNKKPVGIHWVQTATVTLGEWISGALTHRQIWAWRLASVLGAALAALATMAIANRLLGHPAGLYAGALIGASVLLGTEGGIAKTDALLAGLTAWALYALIRLHAASPGEGRSWGVLLWVMVALGVLVKGPVTPMAAGLAAAGIVIWEGRWRWLRPLVFWPGPVLAALILLPWLISVQIATDGAFLREALGGDMAPKLVSGHESHGGPPGYHLILLPVLFFPAILFLPAGVRAAVTALRAGGDPAGVARLLIVMSVPVWIAFELLPTKLPHYVLPAYPALAVLSAWGLISWQDTPALWRWLGGALTVLGCAVLGFVLIAIAIQFDGPSLTSFVLTGLLAGLMLAALTLAIRQKGLPALAALILAALVWHAAGRGIVAPATSLFPAREAAAFIHAEGWLTPQTVIVSSYTEPSLAFALRSDIQMTDFGALALAAEDLATDQVLIVDLSRLPADDGTQAGQSDAFLMRLRGQACATHDIQGFNYSRGRATSLLLARTGDCAQTGEQAP